MFFHPMTQLKQEDASVDSVSCDSDSPYNVIFLICYFIQIM